MIEQDNTYFTIKNQIDNSQYLDDLNQIIELLSSSKNHALSKNQTKDLKKRSQSLLVRLIEMETFCQNPNILQVFSELDSNQIFNNQTFSSLRHLLANYSENNLSEIIDNLEVLKNESQLIVNKINSKIYEVNHLNPKFANYNKSKTMNHFNIEFNRDTEIKNISDLEKNARIWNSILHTFVLVTRSQSEDIVLINLSNKKFEIQSNTNIISSLTKGLVSILNSYHKTLDIYRLQLEVNLMNLSRLSEIKNLLQDEIHEIIEENTAQISQEITSDFNWDNNSNNEVYNLLHVALRQIFSFYEKGGSITSENSIELQELNKKINQAIVELQELKNKINPDNPNQKFNYQIIEDQFI